MKISLKEAEHETYDVCVVGSGPAGIIAALETALLRPNWKILLLEYGTAPGSERNALDDSIRVENLTNHHAPYECTNKGLGGTSLTWGGRCVMYDEIDFLARPIVKGECTWDASFLADTLRHTARSAEYFECGPAEFDLRRQPGLARPRIADHFAGGDVTDSMVERWSMPTRFGSRYEREILESPQIRLLDSFAARSFAARDEGGPRSLEVSHRTESATGKIRARNFVIAAGAQETTRLLLRSGALFEPLGAPPSALGKYYQGHVSGKIASVRFYGNPAATDYGFIRDRDGSYMRRRFQFSTEALLRHNLLNTALWLDNPLYHNPAHGSGAMSFMYLMMLVPFLGKRLAPPAIAHSITKGRADAVGRHLLNVLKDLPGSLWVPFSIFVRRYLFKRKLPGVFLFNPKNTYALHFHAEQVPAPENRMELAADGESLVIHYDLTDADVDSVIRTHEVLDQHLRKCGCGELAYWYGKDELAAAIRSMSKDGVHQVGTTRIADTPADGVVDRNLKVWGTDDIFVCSSSVFPTSGQANPTFFLGACAVRLAQHLSKNAKS
jgi:choline dehydrogenase-like flavoprotein